MNQKVITSFYPTDGAIDMQPVVDKFASAGWIVKQVSTACVDRSTVSRKIGENEYFKPSIAITLLLEKSSD